MKTLPSPDTLRQQTAPGLLLERARHDGSTIAWRSKHQGLYRERSWLEAAQQVVQIAAGLDRLGLARGDRLAIMGDVCEEWVIADQAAQALGAVVYGIYPTASMQELEYQMRDGGASIFVTRSCRFSTACQRCATSSSSMTARCWALIIRNWFAGRICPRTHRWMHWAGSPTASSR
jgi:long-chain acyl-CoA synthetase